MLDIGVGSGAFIQEVLTHWGDVIWGYDVAKRPVEWLEKCGLFREPRRNDGFDVITMWDSIEHMEDPHEILNMQYEWVFVSTPIYESAEHCLSSHHFKPQEHIWYFTEPGLVRFFFDHGYEMIQRSRFEEEFGRKDVGSYVFKRA